MIAVWLLAAIVGALGVWRGPGMLRWSWMRRRLLVEGRQHGLTATWRRFSIQRIEGYRIVTTRNLILHAKVGERALRISPESLGWRREDPPYTWWEIFCEPLGGDEERRFQLNAVPRTKDRYQHPTEHHFETGDAAFDAAILFYAYDRDEPNGDRDVLVRAIIASVEVRALVRALVTLDTDNVLISSTGIHASLRRTGASIDDVRAKVDQVCQLADATLAALRASSVYR